MELTAAYGTLARGGALLQPKIIERIEDSQGRVLYRAPRQAAKQVLEPRIAYLITDMLAHDQAREPAFGEGSALELPFAAAVKTGTTSEWRDNWTIGYSTDYVTGVWVGNANGEPMQHVSGVSGAAPIWNAVMRSIHRVAPAEFGRLSGIVEREVCATSGLLPGPACSHRRTELFPVEQAPTATCNIHRLVVYDSATGKVADTDCPEERRVYQAATYWPADALAWAEEEGLAVPPGAGMERAPMSPQVLDAAGGDTLYLLSPDQNSHYLLTPELPEDMQRIEVVGIAPVGIDLREVVLLVNGQPEHTWLSAPYRTFWTLREGAYEFQLWGTLREGKAVRSDGVRIVVQGSMSKERSTP